MLCRKQFRRAYRQTDDFVIFRADILTLYYIKYDHDAFHTRSVWVLKRSHHNTRDPAQ